MARYTGPITKKSRRLGTDLVGNDKAFERRAYPPGVHGRGRSKESEYLLQLQEKQKARFTYGIGERQFRTLYAEASRRQGVTGENLLRYCELRLDNVVYRAGWAATRPQARQLVGHGHIDVNGRKVNIPSYRLRKGDVVRLRDKARNLIVIQFNMDTLGRTPPAWLEATDGGQEVAIRELPLREQIDTPVREQLIVELYSK